MGVSRAALPFLFAQSSADDLVSVRLQLFEMDCIQGRWC